MVESAEQRTGEVSPGLLQCGDLLVESLQSACGYGLPFADVSSIQDRGDVSQGEPRVLEHAHEDRPLAALSMAFGRKGDARLAARLSDLCSGDTVLDMSKASLRRSRCRMAPLRSFGR